MNTNSTEHTTQSAESQGYFPEVGDSVAGQHLLGARFSGVITYRRPHTINRDECVFGIKFSNPVEIAESDVRTEIVFTGIVPRCGDSKWQDGHGGWFELKKDAAANVAREFSSTVVGLSNESERKLAALIRNALATQPA